MSRQLNALTLKQKIQLLNDLQNNKNKNELCAEYKCSLSTVNRIIKNQDRIRRAAEEGKSEQQKRQRKSLHEKTDKALSMWFHQTWSKNSEITSIEILGKAQEFALKFNENFKPHSNWLFRWRKRQILKMAKIQAESNDNELNNNTENILPQILQNYTSHSIFNAIESNSGEEICPTNENAHFILGIIPSRTEYVHCEPDLECYGTISENETMQEVTNAQTTEKAAAAEENNLEIKNEDNLNDDEVPTVKQVLLAVKVIRKFCAHYNLCNHSLDNIKKEILQFSIKQKKITDYFT